MDEHLTNGVILDECRPGWPITCPSCAKEIRYTILNLSSGEDVYLYCTKCSNFALREEDRRKILSAIGEGAERGIDLVLAEIYEYLQRELPDCECGGDFKIWANVKCPHCRYEFPYNNGSKVESVRYRESKLIWVEGASAYRGALMPSNRLVKVAI